ncbi:NAD-dependent epimerase/dehydratase family protein [Campylobacter jejuni]|uniref:NAD-dependent epimerase/dehydratase family protein n=1 Tax=Campylobacter jejuni TaxID=197 RepID=UPI0007640219|nr:NAD-dependent epimerase/dehydratase family protein [Campylobacter jejuni]EIT3112201.1 NAD-dependent epimerase/dehydratase family protein [Campylobacter coli]EAB5244158.1 NAD-dependent epimerase/dehydratase family protein [Campylobacter jejuni]EAH7048494.1 NAD-dependent epimerase/dehydratase family protein [Campylobacter jejuni]EAH7378219.1 NAD-dependent epimerase/dehydratase family protein [Campylobacter jejuni]EAH7850958.1 NAD-dependent epimerase/dehydratase family protein [Campylobacter j
MGNCFTNPIVNEDLEYIFNSLTQEQKNKFKNSTILFTGCAGFLGFYFIHFFTKYANELNINKIIALDNFMLRKPKWLENLTHEYQDTLELYKFDIIGDKIDFLENACKADLIIHAASIASPMFYRTYPIETLDANIWGLRSLLDFYKDKNIKGFLFFSSSEIYGDPDISQIPTDEEYRGNVACIGPRACYDESKRFGETMCSLFAQKFNIPITIVRPFNNYGPGMSIEDKRVPADFAKAVMEGENIEILSDGSPKRTFCYIADAISGYLKALVYGKFDYFNIGIDQPEISVKDLSNIYAKHSKEIFNFEPQISFAISKDKNYLKDNPNRRCPIIDKARNKLNYNPDILVDEGVGRFLKFLKFEKENGELL